MVNNHEIAVLLFHRISNDSDKLWPAMAQRKFEKLILKIKENTQILSFSELNQLSHYPDKPVTIISFDDGYKDFYKNVMPFFISNHIKANHNICPGLIDSKALPWTQILSLYLSYKTSDNIVFNNKLGITQGLRINEHDFLELCKKLMLMKDQERNDLIIPLLNHVPSEKMYSLMNWEEICYCVKNNIEIGSHGNLHRNLLQVTESGILEDEIHKSRTIIEIKTGVAPKIFAFANALGNDVSRSYVQKSGYQFSLILLDKFLKWQSIKNNEFIEIPRINISRNDWREEYLRALGLHSRVKDFLKIN